MLKVKVEPVEPAFYGKVSLPENPLTIAGYQVFCQDESSKALAVGNAESPTVNTDKSSAMMVDGEACIEEEIGENGETLEKTEKDHEDEEEEREVMKVGNGMNEYVENDVMVDNNVVEEQVVEDGLVMVAETHESPDMIHVPYMETTPNEVLVIEEGADLMVGNMHSIGSDMILEDSEGYVIPAHHTVLVHEEEVGQEEPGSVEMERMDYNMATVHMLDQRDTYLPGQAEEQQPQLIPQPLPPVSPPDKKKTKNRRSPKKEKGVDSSVKKKKGVKHKCEEESEPPSLSPDCAPRGKKQLKSGSGGVCKTTKMFTPKSDHKEKRLKLSPIQCKHPTLSLLLSAQGPSTLLGPALDTRCPSQQEQQENPLDDISLAVDITVKSTVDVPAEHGGGVSCQDIMPHTSYSSSSPSSSCNSTSYTTAQNYTPCASNIPHSVLLLENSEQLQSSTQAPTQDAELMMETVTSPIPACETMALESEPGGGEVEEIVGEQQQHQEEVVENEPHQGDPCHVGVHEVHMADTPVEQSEREAHVLLASEGGEREAGVEVEEQQEEEDTQAALSLAAALAAPHCHLEDSVSIKPSVQLMSGVEEPREPPTHPPPETLEENEPLLEEGEEHLEGDGEERQALFPQGEEQHLPHLNVLVSPIQEKYQTVRSSLQTKLTSKTKGSETLADRYMNEWKPTGRFQCKLCFYSCVTHNFLFRHWVLNHCSLRPYMCGHCGFQSATRDGVTRHQTAKHRGLTRRIFIDNEQQELLWNKFDEMFQGSGFVTESQRRAQVPVTLAKGGDTGILPGSVGSIGGGPVVVHTVAETSPQKGTILKVPQRVGVKNKDAAAVVKPLKTNSIKIEETQHDRCSQTVDAAQERATTGCPTSVYFKEDSDITSITSPRTTNTVLITSIPAPANHARRTTPQQVQPSMSITHPGVPSNLPPVVASTKTSRAELMEKDTATIYKLLAVPVGATSVVGGVDGEAGTSSSTSSSLNLAINKAAPTLPQPSALASPHTHHTDQQTPPQPPPPPTKDTDQNTDNNSNHNMYSLVQSKIEESFQHIKKRLMTSVQASPTSESDPGEPMSSPGGTDAGTNISA